ncbi:MAG: ribosomal-protein-alanine N-acetyltransferase [Chloroflexi bacterium RBG_13_52_12]|nr:MAG: ribosomal-protein-alanine N-acetyltransferase [Chloroflexi bacterium RBG_13_52_12]
MIYSIRPLGKEDLDQVNEIDREAFPAQWPPANYKQELQNKVAHYLVACDDTRTASTTGDNPPKNKYRLPAWLMPWKKQQHSQDIPPSPVSRQYIVGFSGIWMMADEAHITNIAVRQEYRGRGLGEHLLLATIDLAEKLNASFMTLEVRASNLVAQSLYGKYSFTQMGIRRGYYLDNHEDAIIMSTESLDSVTFQAHVRQLKEALTKKLA